MAKMSREEAFYYMGAEAMKNNYVGDDVVECANRFFASEEFQALQGLIGYDGLDFRGRVLVDLGAGNGIASWALAKIGFSVTAVEPDPSPMLGFKAIERLAAETGIRIDVQRGEGEKLSMADNSTDIVYCRSVLHHFKELDTTLREIHRVLRPGGKVFVCREHIVSKPDHLQIALSKHRMYQLSGQMQHMRTLKAYEEAFQEVGFKTLKRLSTFETPINYGPLTTEGLADRIGVSAQRYLGWLLGHKLVASLASTTWFQRIYVLKCRWTNNTPGRLYTFVLQRPK
jgi:ubiquinone/menaquinone biosynthesis C-methylase UbiE